MASGTASRERVVCNQCSLPHYGDLMACPYCETPRGDGTEGSPAPETATEEPSGSDGPQRQGLFARVKNALGM